MTPEAVTPEAVTPEAVTPEAVTPEVTARESLASETPAPEATAGESDVSLTAESGLTPASESAPTDNLAGHATRPSGEPGAGPKQRPTGHRQRHRAMPNCTGKPLFPTRRAARHPSSQPTLLCPPIPSTPRKSWLANRWFLREPTRGRRTKARRWTQLLRKLLLARRVMHRRPLRPRLRLSRSL